MTQERKYDLVSLQTYHFKTGWYWNQYYGRKYFNTIFFYHVAIKDLLLSNKSVELPKNVLISEGGK